MHVQARDGAFSVRARDVLRRALAASAGRQASQVAIESVGRAVTGSGITVRLSVAMGTDVLAAQNHMAALLVGHDIPRGPEACLSIFPAALQAMLRP